MPLSRYRVLDLTTARSGPSAARQLADWGADVIMVEPPNGADALGGTRSGSDFENLNRNKRSIMLDLKQPADLAQFHTLVESADVLLENMRPDVKARLKIDYETLHRINPRLVYGSISGFGQDGPYSSRPGLDQIIQGMAGLMSITGHENEGPVRTGIAISDLSAGLYCAIGILVALLDRESSGKGRWVRTSLLEAQIAMLDFQAVRWLVEGEIPKQEGNHHPKGTPMGLFPTSDGFVNLAAAGKKMFSAFCKLTNRQDLLEDPRFSSPALIFANREQLRAEVAAITKSRSSDDWIADCNAVGIPCGPVNSVPEVFEDPQVKHLGMTRAIKSNNGTDLTLLRTPIQISGLVSDVRSPAPLPGANTEEILRSI